MVGIAALGAYIPRYRLSGKMLAQAWGTGGSSSSKVAVANHDEDTITMATEAVQTALTLGSISAGEIDALFFCSTTPPFKEKLSSAVVAAVCDMRKDVQTVDFCNSVRAVSTAIQTALDGLEQGRLAKVVIVATEMRQGEPSSALEAQLGACSVAMVLGKESLLFEIVSRTQENSTFTDYWRRDTDLEVQSGDPRFIQQQGYLTVMPAVIQAALAEKSLAFADMAKVLLSAPDRTSLKGLLKELQLPQPQGQECMTALNAIGYSGTAMAPMLLAGNLSGLRSGDRVLWANYGDGADVTILRATSQLEAACGELAESYDRQLKAGVEVPGYGRYLRFRQAVAAHDYQPWNSLALSWREETQNLRFYGSCCEDCKTVQFPQRGVCITCGGRHLHEQKLAKTGVVYTYTVDHLFLTDNPPLAMACVDLTGGGRFYGQVTDAVADSVTIGMPVRLTLRKLHEGLNTHNYFWKFRPVE